jgi:chitin synthase
MIYQFSLLASSIIGPATIFLLIVNSLEISLNIHGAWALMIVLTPITIFIILCLVAESEVQVDAK